MSGGFEPRIVGFVCDWCSRSAAAAGGAARRPIPDSVKLVNVACSGRVESHLLIMAYLRGADGVLVTGCLPGQCHYKEGNYHARRRVALLKDIFETLGLDADRLHIEWASEATPPPDGEARYLGDIAADFERQIEQQGPGALSGEMFC
jgi:F420-non-reducing hydrogenase iron-sulfur subunit